MNKLSGKIALVTGGSSGIGLATARLFAEEGAKVILTGRRRKELEEAVLDIGEGAEGVQGDITDFDDLDRLRDHIRGEYGRLDVLFANAGSGALGLFGQVTEEQFDRTLGVNVKGTLFTVQKLLPFIPDGGAIILNSSIAASKGMEAISVYSASKAAIRSFARTWTTDLKARKIRVNVISPGTIDTPILVNAAGFTAEQNAAYNASMAALIPLGRVGHVDEIAKSALFLACDDSSFITGIELTVDGGMAQV